MYVYKCIGEGGPKVKRGELAKHFNLNLGKSVVTLS
jgi:hypothetical protein